jgi:Flp pilus assembly pilin Flp
MSAGSRVTPPMARCEGRAGMKRLLQFFSRDDRDNEPIEYGVIAAGLTLALVVVLAQMGGALTTTF